MLSNFIPKNMMGLSDYCCIRGNGYVILDFGNEYCGGVRLLFNTNEYKGTKVTVRVRFGESLTAFGALCGKIEKNVTAAALLRDGAKGYSTFLSYFISKALADNEKLQEVFDNLIAYYGGMIRMRAKTFWETFDLD